MGGGGQKSTTQEYKEVKLPPWVDAQAQANLAFANEVANRPFQQYTGQTIAPLTGYFDKASGLLGTLDDYQKYYGDAGSALQRAIGYNPNQYTPETVSAMMLPQMDRGAYMNPYIDYTEKRAIDNATRAGQAAQTNLAAAAAKGGGQGGSRQAIQQAVQGAETARGIGDLSAELRSKAYDTATQAMMSDAARKLQADTQTGSWAQQAKSEYERNKLEANQQHIAAAKAKADVADQGQQSRMNQIASYLGFNEIKQAQQQRYYDRAREMWENEWNYPLQQLNLRLAALGMTPYGHTETGFSQTKSGGGGGIGQALGIGGQLLGMLAGFSDREAKVDIEEVGEHPVLPIPLYAYRYKKDPKSYPKVIGPMAQDVEKVAPHLVRKVGKRRVVDLTALVI